MNASFNEEFLIKKPFDKIYPMTKSELFRIVRCIDEHGKLDESGYGFIIGQNISVGLFGKTSDHCSIYIINKKQPLKTPSIAKIIDYLTSIKEGNAYIVCSSLSAKALNFINQTEGYRVITIDNFIHDDFKNTIPIFMGRNANLMIKDRIQKKNIMLRVPLDGYPEYGLGGNIVAQDIYDFIKSNKPVTDHTFKTKGFEMFVEVFKELRQLLIDGKNITGNRWNEILNKHNLIEYLKRGK